MDFTVRYTGEQERFRQQVGAWLEAHLPPELKGPVTFPSMSAAVWEHAKALRSQLGELGWLAVQETVEGDGGGLSAGRYLVLREEMATRGLGWLLEDGAGSLGWALRERGTEEQKQRFLRALARGQTVVWRPALEPEGEMDPAGLGVRAFRDGDDCVLDGDGPFVGLGCWPDLLWVLATSEAAGQGAVATFLVPGALKGISIHTPNSLVPGEVHQVVLDQVRVPLTSLVGEEGEGWPLMQAALKADPGRARLLQPDPQVADLLLYARETVREGMPLLKHPVFQQLIMEAYIRSQVAGLLRMRDAWMRSTEQPLTYHSAQTLLWERRAARLLSETVRQVVGIYALLDHKDPRAPARGRFEPQQRASLSQQDLAGPSEVYSAGAGAGGWAKRRPGSGSRSAASGLSPSPVGAAGKAL